MTSLCSFFHLFAHWDSRKALEDTKKKAYGFLEINVYIPHESEKALEPTTGRQS